MVFKQASELYIHYCRYTPLILPLQSPSMQSVLHSEPISKPFSTLRDPQYPSMPLTIPSKHTVVFFPCGINGPALFSACRQLQEEEIHADIAVDASASRRRMLRHVVWMLAVKDVYSAWSGLLSERHLKMFARLWKRALLQLAKNDVTAAVSLPPLNFAILIHLFLLEFNFIKFYDDPRPSNQDTHRQSTDSQSVTPTTQTPQPIRSCRPRNHPLYRTSGTPRH